MSLVPSRPWHGEPTDSTVIFGIIPQQHPRVIQAAARFTARLGGCLVCVWADEQHIAVERRPDGSLLTTPLDPDAEDDPSAPTDEEMAARLEGILADTPVPWRLYYTTGAPARALHEVAEELDAAAIAIGIREPGLGPWLAEKINGSVAVRLALHQHRPVIMIPHPDPGPAAAERP
jgi:nucleotide-binding universal stress UspA family protein